MKDGLHTPKQVNYISSPILLACERPTRDTHIFKNVLAENHGAMVLTFSASTINGSRDLTNPAYIQAILFTIRKKIPTAKWISHHRWYYIIENKLYERMPGNGNRGLTTVSNGKLRHVITEHGQIPEEIKSELSQFFIERFKS